MIFSYLLVFLLGASFASFFQVILYRRNRGESWFKGRSKCEFCGKNLSFISLIPVFHYVLLRGKSHCCKRKLSIIPAIKEFIAGIIGLFVTYKLGLSTLAILYLILFLFYYFLSIQDIDDYSVYVSDLIFLSIYSIFFHFILYKSFNLLPVFIMGLIFFLVYYLTKKKFGLGDFFFILILTLNHDSLYMSFITLMLGFICAALYGIYLILVKNEKKDSMIPLIPFLTFGSIIHFFLLY